MNNTKTAVALLFFRLQGNDIRLCGGNAVLWLNISYIRGYFYEKAMGEKIFFPEVVSGLAWSKFAPCEHLCQQHSFNLVSSGW
jgi:hypothetical protein